MTRSSQTTVMMAEDHPLVRQGLRALLNANAQIRLVGEAFDGREAVQMARALRPDVILMDISMPVMNGLEATRQILEANPAARIIMLSAHSEPTYVERASAAGVAGFLEKQTSAEFLTEAIHEVAKGNIFFSPSIADRRKMGEGKPRGQEGIVKSGGPGLTQRESRVLHLMAEGSSNKKVAAKLGIGIGEFEGLLQRLMEKLKVRETAGLVNWAIAAGFLENTVELTIT